MVTSTAGETHTHIDQLTEPPPVYITISEKVNTNVLSNYVDLVA